MNSTGRLSVLDDMFLRSHRGLGAPIVLQGLWRTADRVDAQVLEGLYDALRTGPLARRVVRPRVPGARRSWQPNVRAYPITQAPGVLRVTELLDWADAQGEGLDPEYGPGWRLSTAPLDDGGSVVCLTCSHTLADGRALAFAADDALSGGVVPPSDPRARESDWSDARRQWWAVLRGTITALRHGIPRIPAAPTRSRELGAADDRSTHGAILQCSVAEWNQVADNHHGTTNSLFIYLVATVLWTSGFPGETIGATLPVETRATPSVDNDIATTQISIVRTDTPGTIRASARSAYQRRISAPGGMPEELLQVVPDRWAHALSKGVGDLDILCSNIGTLPASLRALGPHRCTGIAARGINPGLTPAQLPRKRLAGYLCRIGDDYVLSLVSLDPARVESASALRKLALDTATAAGLHPRAW
ncbi:hypothetical protein [Nocardia sp. CNY236]|uniref:hypothetical protein n=1 Tax=Nocardia sp. CNY236 TaxID=1169152 RepID=UPI00041FA879|nr:hypothetical protein [Nocardia sp. CNY236]